MFVFPPANTSVSVRPDVNVIKGSSVTLTCSSNANPPVENYTWFKVNESTPVGSGQQYSITNIRSEDGGQYYCEARNKHGAGNSSAVSITVTDLGARSPVLYVVAGVSVWGAAGLICVLVWIRYHKTNTQASKKEHDKDVHGQDVQCSNADLLKSGQSRATSPPSAEAAGGAEDDGHYSTIQPHGSGQTAGGAEDDGHYSTIQPTQTARAQGDDILYTSVQFKKAGAGSPDQPEGELSVIYSSVETRA
ncbi:cell adhesion molecule 4-like [Alosa pseudoharengus]|uniref:cell adhesion molecule 4-like n=1 Tax=Alosa pseudoharengus TaxID=34774 RepID=UPI003F88DF12